jgi:V8-like Glu-specific endopeptidase
MDFIKIQRKSVDLMLRIPAMLTFAGRSSLLQGLTHVALNRSENDARLDLNNLMSELNVLGRLTNEGGVRPVIVVVDNALSYVPVGSEIANELNEVKKQIEEYYGGDVQLRPEQPITDTTYEALVFGPQRDARVQFAFIQRAQDTARSIAQLTVPRIFDGVLDGKNGYGTGWIIAPGILITNHHVIDARDRRSPPEGLGEQPAKPADFEAQAQRITARFDYHVEQVHSTYLECQNAKLLAANQQLDYAVVELEQTDKIADRKPMALVPSQLPLTRGMRVNIVQHPKGGPLRYAIRNNFFVRPADKPAFLFYQTDTEPGASGSPVCNDDWQVVALHHASIKVPPERVPQEVLGGEPITVTLLNEAIQMHDILNDLPKDVKQRIIAAQEIGE